jgi:hypothetical protein
MADSDLVPVGATIVSEVLSAFFLPGGATVTLLADAYLAKKRKSAAELLIREIGSGRHGPINWEEHDIEPLIDTVLRFSKAVEEGAARENLFLLAQVIAGLKKRRAFEADLFRRWCRILEHLSRDELLLIGFAYRTAREFEKRSEEGADNFNKLLRTRLLEAGYSEGETEALLTTVTSTGLMSSASAFGGLAYTPTPWLLELGELADVEAAATLKV